MISIANFTFSRKVTAFLLINAYESVNFAFLAT